MADRKKSAATNRQPLTANRFNAGLPLPHDPHTRLVVSRGKFVRDPQIADAGERIADVQERQTIAPPRQDARGLEQFLELAMMLVAGRAQLLAPRAKAHVKAGRHGAGRESLPRRALAAQATQVAGQRKRLST